MKSSSLHVLVCGGGIAGNAVALQLLRAGVRTTVVERAAAPRPGGQAVDLRGPSREAAERMGLMPGIRAYQLDERGMYYVDAEGREYARMTAEDFDGNGVVAQIELTRGDLNRVLLDAIAAACPAPDYRYGEWVTELAQDPSGVTVRFASGTVERFDLVVGADGVHSSVRAMAFGPEERFAAYLGGYMSFFTIPTPASVAPGWFAMHTVPRAAVAVRPDRDPATAKAVITIRTDADPRLRGDVAAQQRLIRDHLADAGWEAPAVLAAMDTTPDFYFDELVRIGMPTLSAGRVVLLGDSGFCGSPLTGMGTATAIVGAYLLAGEIAAAPDDLAGALARYETLLRPLLAKAQQVPGGGIKAMLPTSRFGVRAGRVAMRAMLSKPMRPVMRRMLTDTEDFALPAYA